MLVVASYALVLIVLSENKVGEFDPSIEYVHYSSTGQRRKDACSKGQGWRVLSFVCTVESQPSMQ